MILQNKETIWREYIFEDGTTQKQITDYIEKHGIENICDAPFYISNELILETTDCINPDFNQDGYETITIMDETDHHNEVYCNNEFLSISNLRKQYRHLDNNIVFAYDEVINKVSKLGKEGIYFCDTDFIKDDHESTFDELRNMGDVQDLPQLYYNNYRGVEKFGYLFHFDRYGITIIDNDDYELTEIQLNDLNGMNEKLNILEEINSNLK